MELEEALATMLDIIKSVNDSMHQIAITGFEVFANQCLYEHFKTNLLKALLYTQGSLWCYVATSAR